MSYPHYVGGEWDCPPENCGGIPGYYNMLNALADPNHPDHAEVAEYLQDWDPKEIDELPLKIALGRIANRRNAAKTRIAKKPARCNADRNQDQPRHSPDGYGFRGSEDRATRRD